MIFHLISQQCERLNTTLTLLQEQVQDNITAEIADSCAEIVTGLLSGSHSRITSGFDNEPELHFLENESTSNHTSAFHAEALLLAWWLGRHVWLWGQPWRWAGVALGMGAGYALSHKSPIPHTLLNLLTTVERLHTIANPLGSCVSTLNQALSQAHKRP